MIDTASGITLALNASDEPALTSDSDRGAAKLFGSIVGSIACYNRIIQSFQQATIDIKRSTSAQCTRTTFTTLHITSPYRNWRCYIGLASLITNSTECTVTRWDNLSSIHINLSPIFRNNRVLDNKCSVGVILIYDIVIFIYFRIFPPKLANFQTTFLATDSQAVTLSGKTCHMESNLFVCKTDTTKIRHISNQFYRCLIGSLLKSFFQRGILCRADFRHILCDCNCHATYCHQ